MKQPNFTDYRILQLLLPRFWKKNLETLVDQELSHYTENLNAAERAFFLEKLAAWGNLEKQISEQNLTNIVELENKIAKILFEMEQAGVNFDAEKMTKIGEEIREKIAKLEKEIYEIIGEKININSPKQLQYFFFEKLGITPIKKTKTGFSVDNDVLVEIAKTHNIARLILEYRSLAKLSSTYVDGLLHSVSLFDGKIHTRYDSLGAVTGRMSSNDPNLQNIPTGEGYPSVIKSCFIPSEGNIFVVADYSQIELRILAFLSQDKALLSAFQNGEDIHTRTAKFLFGEKEISSHERRIAKTVNFGVIYGITGFWLSKTLECSPWEANKYIESFYAKYPHVKEYYEEILENARASGYVETFFGRKRFTAGINDANKTLRQVAEREAMNMPIQWTAADILKLAMIELDRRITEEKLLGKMILQIHDELVFDVPIAEKEIFEKLIKEVMEDIMTIQKIRIIPENMESVPLLVDIWTGNNWHEAK